ncbi:isoprenylcysteine carboxylmethyltransferase family protein [Sanguibacter sp. 25GB23B1]|uniref:methyltransferase family protein n=1 Tax=unclassified Sanguibacter TaxID=2645534 RepID=UPI0032AFCA72
MTADTTATAALLLYVVGLVVTFGVRSWLHRRRTGSTGLVGFSSAIGAPAWWGGVSFVLALVLTGAGLGLAATEAIDAAPAPLAGTWTGVVVAVAGFLGVLVSQSGMGTSWRIGVRPGEETELVTDGPFAWLRNPIFTAMIVAVGGLVLAVPSPMTLAGLVFLVLGIEIQVRVTEEPHLLATHGAHYADYASRVGRFLPGVGTLPAPLISRTSA